MKSQDSLEEDEKTWKVALLNNKKYIKSILLRVCYWLISRQIGQWYKIEVLEMISTYGLLRNGRGGTAELGIGWGGQCFQ